MGMHYGIVAANCSWSKLYQSLRPRVQGLTDKGTFSHWSEFSLEPTDDGFSLACGEHQGRAYLIDGSFSISARADLIFETARELGTLVVGCGAETVSGSFWLTVADGEILRRLYWQCHMELSTPLSIGETFECEARESLDDINGEGIFAVLKSLSFDFDAWSATVNNHLLSYPMDVFLPEDGRLMTKVNDHRAKFKLKDEDVPPIQLIGRIIETPRPTGGLFSKVFRFFLGK